MRLIYGLVDPVTKLVRYIGKSTSGLRRPKMHKYDRHKSHKVNWMKGLIARGLTYEITVLEYLPMGSSEALLLATEIYWIAYGRASGWPLTNITPGGRGAPEGEYNPSKRLEIRAKISERHKTNPKVQANLARNQAKRDANPNPCGTQAGYSRALNANKRGVSSCGPCEACMKASADYARNRRHMKHPRKPYVVPDCGTTAKYNYSMRRRDQPEGCGPCEDCKTAKREYDRSRPPRIRNR